MEQPLKKVSWVKALYRRAPWIRVRYGRRVLPPNNQMSNISLTADQVMQRRTELVGRGSAAKPLNKGDGPGEQAGAKN